MSEATITAPASAVRELAKWAYAAAEYDGMVGRAQLEGLPVVGALVSEIARRDGERVAAEFPGAFADL